MNTLNPTIYQRLAIVVVSMLLLMCFSFSGTSADLLKNSVLEFRVAIENCVNDADCDGVPDADDLCPGGDDSIDSDNDGVPDCADWDGMDDLPDDWKCGNNNNKVVICHIPQGNPDNANTLCVSPNAVPTHIADGDYIGACMVVSCDDGGNDCCFPGVLTDNTLTGDGNPDNELSVNLSNDANNQLTLGTDGALYAGPDADNDPGNEIQTLTKSGSQITLSNGGGSVNDEVNDADADPANEYNTGLNLSGTTLALTDGGSTLNVDLSGLPDDVDDADNDPGNEIQTLTKSGSQITLSNGGGSVNDEVNDADADPANEYNTGLNLSGTTLALTDGGSTLNVDLSGLPDDVDDADNDPGNELQDLSLAGNTLSLSDDPSPVDLSPYLDNTDNQTLSLSGDNLSISGGNTVNLSSLGAWSLTGNAGTAPGANFLGTTDATDMLFKTNGNSRMRLVEPSSGNIFEVLELYGDENSATGDKFRIGENLRLFNGNPSGMGMEWTRVNDPGNTYFIGNWIGSRNDYDMGFETNGDFIFSSGVSGVTERDQVIIRAGTEATRARVGIGTMNPLSRLHVVGSGNNSSSLTSLFEKQNGDRIFWMKDDGNVFVGEDRLGTSGGLLHVISNEPNQRGIVVQNKDVSATSASTISFYVGSGFSGGNEGVGTLGYFGESQRVELRSFKPFRARADRVQFKVGNGANDNKLVDIYSITGGSGGDLNIDAKTNNTSPVRATFEGGQGYLSNIGTLEDGLARFTNQQENKRFFLQTFGPSYSFVPALADKTLMGTLDHDLYIMPRSNNNLHLGRDNGVGNLVTNLFVDNVNSRIGIGTTTPANTLDVDSGTSGLSGLTLSGLKNNNPSGDVLSVDDATGEVILVPPSGGSDDWGTQVAETDATISGNGTIGNELSVNISTDTDNQLMLGTDGALFSPGDTDADPTNELQNLGVSGDDLSISGGNTVDLSFLRDADWYKSGMSSSPSSINDPIYTEGLVGIGINTPAYPLHILSDANLRSGIAIRRADGNGDRAHIYSALEDGIFATRIRTNNEGIVLDDNDNKIFHLRKDRIGIGTYDFLSEPGARLHIIGQESGSLTVGSQPLRIDASGSIYPYAFTINHAGNLGIGGVGFTALNPSTGTAGEKVLWWQKGIAPQVTTINNTFSMWADDFGTGEVGLAIRSETGTIHYFGNNVGIGTTTPSEKLHVTGNVFADGGIFITSDERFKKDVRQLDGVLDKINQLDGVSYTFRKEEFREKGLADGPQLGLIAQNLEAVYPELVKTYADGYKAVNYDGLIPVLIEGLKAQQQEIEALESERESLREENEAVRSRLDDLEARMDQIISFRGEEAETINHQEVYLKDVTRIVLNQNVPNPFKEHTSISYFLPEDTKQAELFIMNENGQILKKVSLQAGEGILEVYASDLSSGVYSYSLVVDGKVMEAKQMILTK